jgi:hypothetical protein
MIYFGEFLKELWEEFLTEPRLDVFARNVGGAFEIEASFPLLDSALPRGFFPFLTIEENESIDVPSEKIAAGKIVGLLSGILDQGVVVRGSPFWGAGEFYLPREDRGSGGMTRVDAEVGALGAVPAILLDSCEAEGQLRALCKELVEPTGHVRTEGDLVFTNVV